MTDKRTWISIQLPPVMAHGDLSRRDVLIKTRLGNDQILISRGYCLEGKEWIIYDFHNHNLYGSVVEEWAEID
jgi:hypothetical protein